MGQKYTHLSAEERAMIEIEIGNGASLRSVAPKFDSWSRNSGQPQWCRFRKSTSYPAIPAALCCVTPRLLSS